MQERTTSRNHLIRIDLNSVISKNYARFSNLGYTQHWLGMTTSAVSLDLTKAFDTVSHAILGSLSNDDGAATRTANKTIDLLRKTTTLHVQHTFLYISLPSLHDYGA